MKNELTSRFSLEREVAKGRMSTLYEAVEEGTGRRVAVKVLHDHLRQNESVRQRLRRELAAVRRLDHPAILRIEDLIETDDVMALVMEFVDGVPVREFVRQKGAQSWEVTKEIIDEAAEALEHAHDRGILHRDLSAHHVLITPEGGVKIVGFGMARVDELVGLTMHTRVLGALEAMAPERILGMSYDGRADIYSLGSVAWELLTGHPIFDGGMSQAFSLATDSSSFFRQESESLPPELPAQARYVLERALARDPGVRFATFAQMRRALDGDYDVALWNAWTARQTEFCPQCETPIIDGFSHCIECDFEFRRLIQEPGAGDSMIQIISSYEAHTKDVWFEANTEARTLTETQFRSLMEFLQRYDDTAALADGSWEYYWPPYFLFNRLERREAERISELLAEVGVHNKVIEYQGPPGRFKKLMHAIDLEGQLGPTLQLLVIVIVMLSVFGSAVGPFWLFGALAILAIGAVVGVNLPTRVAGLEEDKRGRQTYAGLPLLGPPEALTLLGNTSGKSLLPARTAAVLKELDDDEIRREVYELIVLATSISADEGDRSGLDVRISELVDEILNLGAELDGVVSAMDKRAGAELVARLEGVEARLEETENTEEIDEGIEEKLEILSQLKERDRLEYRRAYVGARLLKVRAALLEVGSPGVGRNVVDGSLDLEIDEIRLLFDVQDEVESLVEAPLVLESL